MLNGRLLSLFALRGLTDFGDDSASLVDVLKELLRLAWVCWATGSISSGMLSMSLFALCGRIAGWLFDGVVGEGTTEFIITLTF